MKTSPYFNKFIYGIESEIQVEFKDRFSASMLPYCPILDYENHGASRTTDYHMSFYTAIGTAYHKIAQQHLVASKLGKYMWGNWELQGKKYYNCFRPKPANDNGIIIYPEYLEVDLKYSLLTGHADCLVKLKDGWHLLDFKTTSHFIHDGGKKIHAYYPQEKHIIQLKAYTLMLRRKGIKIKQYHIVYVSRNKSNDKAELCFKTFSFKGDLKSTKQHIIDSIKGRKAVLKVVNKDGSIKDIYKNKPCKKPNDYYEMMQKGFFGEEKCPHHKSGKCYNEKKMLKEMGKWQ